jgi:hypothetical protein
MSIKLQPSKQRSANSRDSSSELASNHIQIQESQEYKLTRTLSHEESKRSSSNNSYQKIVAPLQEASMHLQMNVQDNYLTEARHNHPKKI